MKHGEDELAVEQFEQLNMAEASYYQAQVRGGCCFLAEALYYTINQFWLKYQIYFTVI